MTITLVVDRGQFTIADLYAFGRCVGSHLDIRRTGRFDLCAQADWRDRYYGHSDSDGQVGPSFDDLLQISVIKGQF